MVVVVEETAGDGATVVVVTAGGAGTFRACRLVGAREVLAIGIERVIGDPVDVRATGALGVTARASANRSANRTNISIGRLTHPPIPRFPSSLRKRQDLPHSGHKSCNDSACPSV
jgi:hypothetical protein